MIRLENTTVKLQVVLAGAVSANQLQCTVSFFDENVSGERTRGSSQQTNTNSTTDVDICNALGTGKEGFVRNIDTLTVYNRDTAAATVTVKKDDGGTETILVKATLATLETLAYDHESGWRVTTAAGATKMAQASMALDDLSDVTITSVASGDVLFYNGTAWVNQTAAASGASWVLISTATASNSATIDFTSGLTSTYDLYVITLTDIIPASDNVDLYIRFSQSASFLSGASDYAWVRTINFDGTGNDAADTADAQIYAALSLGTGTGETFSGVFTLFNPAGGAKYKVINWSTGYYSATPNLVAGLGTGLLKANVNAIDGIRFAMSSGNIASGRFALYGVRK